MSKIVVDTSVLINGQLVSQIELGQIKNSEIIIPRAVLDELQSQASQKRNQGHVGLETIKKLREMSDKFGLNLVLLGSPLTADDIKMAERGRIDAIIKDIAKQNHATLYTSDNVQHLVAEAEGLESVLLKPILEKHLEFFKFFDLETMSVHLKENLIPLAKKGKPGNFILTKINDEILTKPYLESISSQILNLCKTNLACIEISKNGAIVVQYDDYRIAITTPPFSEKIEITIVHPIVKLSLTDYRISDELMTRFSDRAEGIIICGPPGSGKSTLASSLANFYHSKGKIVKTFESPRDLQVDKGITQYTKLDGSFDNSADILLLVRPDYTIFDEIRRREDFTTFADLRLTGVGMVGVVHANSSLDAIQRFIGKIELGIIPNVIDTVIFVKDGMIGKIYVLSLTVKVPTGMTESDLARPVIEIRNFEDSVLEHEVYTFGEENVIVPISKKIRKVGIEKLAEDKLRDIFKKYDPQVKVEILSDNSARVSVDEQYISSIIGRGGSNINEIEKSLKIHIDVVEKNSHSALVSEIPFRFSESKNTLMLTVNREYSSMRAEIYVLDEYVAAFRIGKKGQITIPKRSEASRYLTQVAKSQNDIKVYLKDF